MNISTIGGSGSYHFGPQMITDGLEFYYDVGNLYGYDPTSNSLLNLANGAISGSSLLRYSASINPSVTINPRNGGCLYAASSLSEVLTVNKYVRSDYISNKTNLTLAAWFYCSGSFNGVNNGNIFYSLGNGNQILLGTANVGLRPYSAQVNTYFNSSAFSIINTGTSNTWAPNIWNYWAVTISEGTTTSFFGNGRYVSATPISPSSITSVSYLIEDSYPFRLFTTFVGFIGPVAIYNRALSQSELLYNYNRIKQRFNNF